MLSSINPQPISIHALLAESDEEALDYLRDTADFYPRSPCGERPHKSAKSNKAHEFLSTLSLRRATDSILAGVNELLISIHALLAESDNLRVVDGSKSSIISIHALLAESDLNASYGALAGASISIHALLAESDKYSTS